MYEVLRYVTADGRDLFGEWLGRLRDRQGRLAVERRLLRVAAGNLGDHKFLSDGVWELRIQTGPGYRVYYGLEDRRVVLLLAAGDKGSQRTDIARAVQSWKEWKEEQDASTKPR